MGKTSFMAELRRRRVGPIAGAYIAIAWLITEIARFFLEQANAPGWTVRILAIAFIVGFPIAVGLAWTVQIEPDGKRKFDPSTGQRRNVTIAVCLGLIITVGLSWWTRSWFDDAPAYDPIPNSVAIMPFVDSDATPGARNAGETLYVALKDGFSKSALSQVELKIDPTPGNLAALGRQYRLASVLAGELIRTGSRLQIQMTLIDVRSDEVRWTDTYDWDPTRIREMGTEITNGVLESMNLPVISEKKFAGTNSLEAYEAYLQGHRYRAAFVIPELRLAMQEFEQAFTIDPEFVHAYYELAQTIGAYLGMKGPEEEEREQLERRQAELLETAQTLDSNFAPLISLLGLLSGNLELAYAACDRALELEPDHAETYQRYAQLKRHEGDFEEAERLLRKALEYRPMDASWIADLGTTVWRLHRFDEAVALVEKSIELEPRLEGNYRVLGAWNSYVLGNLDQSVYYMRRAYEVNPEVGELAGFVGASYASLGMREEAMAWKERALETSPTNSMAWTMAASIHMRLGEHEASREYEAEAIRLRGWEYRAPEDIKDPDASTRREALERWESENPDIALNEDAEIVHRTVWRYKLYMDVLLRAGEQARGRGIADRLIEFLEPRCADGPYFAGSGYNYCNDIVHIYASVRDKESALREMRSLIIDRHNRYNPWQYKEEPYEFLHDDPEYQEIMAYLQADLAAQADRVRRMECSGEMPGAPGLKWMPECP
jgi:tetratricopeptide (TPR) repeat protein